MHVSLNKQKISVKHDLWNTNYSISEQKPVLAECSLLSVIKITYIIIDSHHITSSTLSPSLRITVTMFLLSDLAW